MIAIEDLVVPLVLGGFAFLNLCGIALYHYTWKHEVPHKDWKCKEFYLWTAYMFIVGVCYLILRGVLKLVELIKHGR